ncbi:Tfp pilus assembly protein PilF [Pedobacter sp. W3I1]|uniref:hypothetical protein n=1 Tax=Pedobacter sp. W3I1 TaxID=3042291 RepID=UPI002783CE02|nr:hypothetical protein [Pedobacter sp. W3I1]MDQ0640187.1 Tfp pilus assembly protein PilF [Pedobacter sp. W3I1]
MKNKTIITTLIFIFCLAVKSHGQLPMTKTVFGQLSTVEDGMLQVPPKDKYTKVADSLDKNLQKDKNDTFSLFNRSLIYYAYNQMLAQPYQCTKGTLENLTRAKTQIEKAVKIGMQDFRARQLRAQIYSELCYRFTNDESWMFSKVHMTSRKELFDNYKVLANRYIDELAMQDKNNAYQYTKRKISFTYKL